MALEIEAKFKVGSHGPIRERLRRAGARPAGKVLETNCLFDTADGKLRRAGCGLRIRVFRVPNGKPPSPTLTYKGPVRPGRMKAREELETTLADLKTGRS